MGRPTRVRVAHIRRAHGLKGELLVRPLTANPAAAFVPGRELFTVAEGEGVTVRLRAARPAGDAWLLAFEGVHDRTQADAWRGRDLWLGRADFEALGETDPPLDDLVGLRLELSDGTVIGTVANFYELPQGPMLEVTRPHDTVLFPLHPDFVSRLDTEEGVLVVAPPDGLFD